MDNGALNAFTVLCFKLAQYREKHDGKTPARIFASKEAMIELANSSCNVKPNGSVTFYGVPVITFFGAGKPEVYLSEEES